MLPYLIRRVKPRLFEAAFSGIVSGTAVLLHGSIAGFVS